MGARLKPGQRVWVAQSAPGGDTYASGVVHELREGGRVAAIHLERGGGIALLPVEQPLPAQPGSSDVPDHTQLMHLNGATVLENTRLRFGRDRIYSTVGQVHLGPPHLPPPTCPPAPLHQLTYSPAHLPTCRSSSQSTRSSACHPCTARP